MYPEDSGFFSQDPPTTPPLKLESAFNAASTSRSSDGNVIESEHSFQLSSIGYLQSSKGDSRPEWVGAPTPPSNSTVTINLDKRKKGITRDLIDIFERNASPPPANGPTFIVPPASQSLRYGIKASLNDSLPELPKSSYLRQSFRNLAAAFNKAKKAFNEQHFSASSGVPRPLSDYPKQSERYYCSAPFAVSRGLGIPSQPKATISRLVPRLSPDLRSGIILYLTSDKKLLLWHRSSAFLAAPNLHLSYFEPSGKYVNRVIRIDQCVDVRPIASSGNGFNPPPVLDGNVSHVFELEFCDGIIERFAAESVLERDGWISAIWDSIVSSCGLFSAKSTYIRSQASLPLSLPSKPHDSNLSCVPSIRGVENENYCINSYFHGLTATPKHFTTEESVPNWSTGSLTASQSIRTLGQISIVSQRLAQLEMPINTSKSAVYLDHTTSLRTSSPARHLGVPSSYPRANSLEGKPEVLSPSPSSLQSPIPLRSPSMVSSRLSMIRPSNGTRARSRHKAISDPEIRATPEIEFKEMACSLPDPGPAPIETPTNVDSTRVKRSFHPSRIPSPCMEVPSLKGGLEEVLLGIWNDIQRHRSVIKQLDKRLVDMHADVKIAVLQQSLPLPRLDDLRSRLETLTNDLHSTDFPGIHSRLDMLQEKNQESEDILENELLGSRDRLAEKLQSIEEATKSLTGRKENGGYISIILEKLGAIQQQIESNDTPPPVPEKDDVPQLSPFDASLQNMGEKLESLQALVTSLQQYKDAVSATTGTTQPQESFGEEMPEHSPSSVFRKRSKGLENETIEAKASFIPSLATEIAEILNLVKQDHDHRSSISTQLDDTVRYLNELNSWMEAFLGKTSGSEQFLQKISEILERIAQGPAALNTILQNIERGANGTEVTTGILEGVHSLLSHAKTQECILEELKGSIQETLVAIQENSKQQAEIQESQGTSVILDLLEKNKREHEALFKSITDRLSADIRGERIRFIDAMKEATTVNVTAQIEEFKRQLSKEVMVMLQEVGRTARFRERKYLEQEIAEIFNQQADERQTARIGSSRPVSSSGFQPIQQSVPPCQPYSRGPYPAFMMQPVAEHGTFPNSSGQPMPLHPNLTGRPLPVPTPGIRSHPSPGPQPPSMSIVPTTEFSTSPSTPVRRKV